MKKSLMVVLVALAASLRVQGAVIEKENNNTPLNQGGSWIGGVAPESADIVYWGVASPNNTTTLVGGDVSWLGIWLGVELAQSPTFSGGSIELGGYGIYAPSSTGKRSFTLSSPVSLAADQTWQVGLNSGQLTLNNPVTMNGHTLTLSGGNTKQFKGSFLGTGTVFVSEGALKLTNQGTKATDTDIVLQGSGSFSVDKDVVAWQSDPLANSLTFLDGRAAGINGSSKNDQTIVISNRIVIGRGGQPRLSFYTQSGRHITLFSDQLACETNVGSYLFTGTQLGLFDATQMTDAVNILFSNPPALLQADGATGATTLGILRGATADYDSNDEYGIGLVTYDADKGARLLDFDTEYTSSIADGEGAGNNVRLANEGGVTNDIGVLVSQIVTNHLAAPLTVVNSLSLVASGAHGNAGIVLEGEEGVSLRLASGVLFASQSVSGTKDTTDRTFINLPIDLNEQQGLVINERTDGMSNGTGQALTFNESPCNDAGKGIVFAGNGSAYLQWTNTLFTGPVMINSGWFRITGTGNNSVIPTKLVLYGGSVQNHGNRIADTADIEIHGGSLSQKGGETNSGSGTSETFDDLIMTGGGYSSGADGTSSGSTTLNNAYLSGGAWTLTRGHTATVRTNIFLSESARINFNSAATGYRPLLIMQSGTITITNATANAEWMPLSLGTASVAGITPPGVRFCADIRPCAALVFVGNSVNTHAAVINTGVNAEIGRLELTFSQVFDVGDGAADVDLRVLTDVVDGATNKVGTSSWYTVPGALVKAGAGTLELAGKVTLTGADGLIVSNGGLRVTGMIACPVSVESGAALSGSGMISNNVTFAQGAFFAPSVNGIGAVEVLTVTNGVVSGSAQALVPSVLADTKNDQVLLTSDTAITANFVSSDPNWSVTKRNSGTEVWLARKNGTVVLLF